MVNFTLVEAILREQNDPGSSTTRQIRELYNTRSGEDPIVPHTDGDKEFQTLLLKALEVCAAATDEEKSISYTVKLKDSNENQTSAIKRRSIIKLPKEAKSQSESDDASSDTEKVSTASSITITKPFSPLFLNNMKKFGVSTDWLAKRSNSARHSSYSRSSIKTNTNQLDAMIKSASAKPIRSSRKLSFIETDENKPMKLDFDKENVDPTEEVQEVKEKEEEPKSTPTPYDLSSDEEEEKDQNDEISSSPSNGFSLRIPRVDMKKKRTSASPSLSSEDDEPPKVKKPTKIKKTAPKVKKEKSSEEKSTTAEEEKKPTTEKKEKNEAGQTRIEHLKKLLRTAGIRSVVRKTELDALSSTKAKVNYLKSLFDSAGFTGNLSLKDCEKFRKKREDQKELEEIQSNAVTVKGHVKGGRTLRGQARISDEPEPAVVNKRKRAILSDSEDNADSTDDDEPIVKKRRPLKMEASPEVSEQEMD